MPLEPTFTILRPELGDTQERLLAKLLYALQKPCVRGTLLASAARITSTATGSLDWSGYSAVIIYLNITVASGTGGIRPFLEYQDPVSNEWRACIVPGSSAITTAVMTPYVYGLKVSSGLSVSINAGSVMGIPIGAAVRVNSTHADASSYTYSIGYELIP